MKTRITIYGKSGCKRCEAAKEKMKLLGVEYDQVNIDKPPDDWRKNGIVDAMAWACRQGGNHIPVPIICIDGQHYGYSDGMKALKKMRLNA